MFKKQIIPNVQNVFQINEKKGVFFQMIKQVNVTQNQNKDYIEKKKKKSQASLTHKHRLKKNHNKILTDLTINFF